MKIDDIILLDGNCHVAVKVMDEFDDVFVTSSGLFVYKDDALVLPADGAPVMYNACYALRLPVTWYKQRAAFYDTRLVHTILYNDVRPDYVGCFNGVDYKLAKKLDDVMRKKAVLDKVFLSDDGRMFSNVILYNN